MKGYIPLPEFLPSLEEHYPCSSVFICGLNIFTGTGNREFDRARSLRRYDPDQVRGVSRPTASGLS
ncbi:MAG: hypothetical protein ACREJQ_03785, partial [bacterium]